MWKHSVCVGTGQNGDIQNGDNQNGDTPKRRHNPPFWYVADLVVSKMATNPKQRHNKTASKPKQRRDKSNLISLQNAVFTCIQNGDIT